MATKRRGSPQKTIRWTPADDGALDAVRARALALGLALEHDAAVIRWAMRIAAEATATQARRAAT